MTARRHHPSRPSLPHLTLAAMLCFLVSAKENRPKAPQFRIGALQSDAIRECSGVVASRRHKDVFWTHNDSGNPAMLFAIRRDGTVLREYPVKATNTDWEDIAIDDAGRLYIADTGNNQGARKQVQVLQIDEPDPTEALKEPPAPLRVKAYWRINYPEKPFDCESLFVLDGKAYLLPKRLNVSPAEIFRFDLQPAVAPVTLKRVASLPDVRGPVTAADISADGKRLALLTVLGPYVLTINGDVVAAGKVVPRFSRYIDPNMEAACFVADGLLVINEPRDMFVFRDEHFTPAK